MSNALAVATVTATLQKLLFAGLNSGGTGPGGATDGTAVTTRPPDRARAAGTGNQINVFLYQTGIEAAWRNVDLPGKVKPGETGRPPLPLVLHYLITAYAESDDDIVSHRLIGRAMSVLHDHPTLGRNELQTALLGGDLHEQVERVHVTPQTMSIEELSKLWTTFQTPLRISAAYQACVVLIESTTPPVASLPVLKRGTGDAGPDVGATLDDGLPRIASVTYERNQPSALLGGRVVILGRALSGAPAVSISNRRVAAPVALTIDSSTDTRIEVDLPTDPTAVPAGDYELVVSLVAPPAADRATPPAVLTVAPRIVAGLPGPVAVTGGTLTLMCEPEIRPGQTVSLILGSTSIEGVARAGAPDQVDFDLPALPAGSHVARLRVDGVDSQFVDRTVAPPVFDSTQVMVAQ